MLYTQGPKLMLSTADLAKLRGTSNYKSAYREMKLLQDVYGRKTIKSITVFDYGNYHGIPADHVLMALGRRPMAATA